MERKVVKSQELTEKTHSIRKTELINIEYLTIQNRSLPNYDRRTISHKIDNANQLLAYGNLFFNIFNVRIFWLWFEYNSQFA